MSSLAATEALRLLNHTLQCMFCRVFPVFAEAIRQRMPVQTHTQAVSGLAKPLNSPASSGGRHRGPSRSLSSELFL
ncbi:hypothetical protein AK812_SmicGene30952 [Symbiodinium microadriaticum]|uniref:Uncharacterized protein n=1 Tax=Symbiodinium microadriaticum TaxID=2951 RepID=A0A1Q9CXZ6_SYMMI|nr:hypothetical protein AK812_SmicGene30952 [Symbiodinium microadriaticum]